MLFCVLCGNVFLYSGEKIERRSKSLSATPFFFQPEKKATSPCRQCSMLFFQSERVSTIVAAICPAAFYYAPIAADQAKLTMIIRPPKLPPELHCKQCD